MNMAVSLLLAIILAICTPAIFGQNTPEGALAGEYITSHEYGGGKLTLKTNGTFEQKDGSDDGTFVTTTGNIHLTDDKLLFSITKSVIKRGDDQEYDLFDPEVRQRVFGAKEPFQKEFSMFTVKWSDRIYLIDESDMKRFADAVNMGIEPRNALHSWRSEGSPWMGSFFLRSGDEKKKVVGPPPISQPWRDMLLERPVTGKVIRIDKTEKINEWNTEITATINRGSNSGLKVGMKLVIADAEEPSAWDGPEVISVDKRTAQVKMRLGRERIKVGSAVSSRYHSPYPVYPQPPQN
jgi:hypothetical protein